MNTAQAERLCQKTRTCPPPKGCGSGPGRRCWRPADDGHPRHRTYLARPHEVRVELIRPADWSN
jgi:hypothetical protein